MNALSLWARVALACVLAPVCVFGAWYVKFDGVDGEVTETSHKGWCTVESLSQAIRRAPSTPGTPRANRVSLENFAVVKSLDKASPKLAEAVCTGKVIPKVEIHLASQLTGAREPQVYLRYELENVQITSYQLGATASQADPRPTEQMSLNFERIKMIYTEYDAAGRSKGNVEFEWKVEEGES